MIQAILLDLDDTLLDNDMGSFLPPYFAALGQRMSCFVDPDQLVKILLASTRVMMRNEDPAVTNRQAFEADFLPRLGHPESEVRPVFDAFYEEDFPALRRYTHCRPEARMLVQTIYDQGYDMVIATNPLFPARAIEHRLNWAGVLDYPYELVTTYENSHFSKPNPRYYKEILDKVNCSPPQAVMVGDDFGNDIEPATFVGLHTYWISDTAGDGVFSYAGLQGTLADCLAWVQSGGLREL
jgi:HAD superfamily hydrolase (TIGR01662 family)